MQGTKLTEVNKGRMDTDFARILLTEVVEPKFTVYRLYFLL